MADDLATLQARRDALSAILTSGVAMVRDAFRSEVQYSSPEQLKAAIAWLDSEIARLSARPVQTIRFCTSKGL